MTNLFLACLFCLPLFVIGQTTDTTYYNKSWKLCKKEKALYYRVINKEHDIFMICDFYKNGVLQMRAYSETNSADTLSGPCQYYYPNGKLQSAGYYYRGDKIGVWSYYTSTGELVNNYNYNSVANANTQVNDSIQRQKNQIPVSHLDKNFSLAVRGKVLSFFAFEDIYFRTASIGVEFLIKGRHSLGIDYTYFRWRFESDDTDDNPLKETYERREYVYVDYRYRIFSYRNVDYYFNLYDKIGTYSMWQEGVSDGYNFWEKASVNDKTNGTFNQVGAGIGLKVYADSRFYFDVSANGGILFSNNNIVTYDTLFVADKRYNVKEDKGIFYIRFNAGYKLFVKRKNEEHVNTH